MEEHRLTSGRLHSGHSALRRLAFGLLTALLLTVATVAQAQDPNPHATAEQAAAENDLDTDVTPVAKRSELWTLVHGTPYPKTETVEDSITTFDADLFAVSFENTTIGLAGGSACAIEPVQENSESDADFGTRAAKCEGTDGSQVARVPALYRYHEPPDEDPGWERLELPGDDTPGYIGAIAWIDSERALIVGGTGTYPRREAPYDGKDATDPAKGDEAGKARAWIYTRTTDQAEELDLSQLRADEAERAGMRGLSAVDCYRDPTPGLRDKKPDPNPDIELCFAGALGQIWEFRDDEFTGKRVDAQSPSADLSSAALFAYRVRDLALTDGEPPTGLAVTSGCCGETAADNRSRTLFYQHDPNRNPANPAPPRWYAGINDRPELPDSYYSVLPKPGTDPQRIFTSVVATPGGPEQVDEAPSAIAAGRTHSASAPGGSAQAGAEIIARRSLGTARLLSGSGDVAGADPMRPAGVSGAPVSAGQPGIRAKSPDPDGQPDWVVGELRSTERRGLGAQALVVATALPPGSLSAVNALGPSPSGNYTVTNPPTAAELIEGYEPVDQEKADAYRRSSHYLLPSYTANQVEIVGEQEDGWAVGDHGAILRLSEKATQAAAGASEPKPPRLKEGRPKPLSDRDPYEDSRPPLAAAAGTVPAQGEETVELPEPEMLPSGPVAEVDQIIMSRDGSEGWAIGNDPNGGWTFSHFDGRSWSVCDPHGIEGISKPDPACEAMAPLAESGKSFISASRVPLENDPYPQNDNELEIVAIGSKYKGPETNDEQIPTVVRYSASEGRWDFEDPERLAEFARGNVVVDRLGDVAFTRPNDGWVIADVSDSDGIPRRLFRFTGSAWIDCVAEPAACGEATSPRLPKTSSELKGLTVAGTRVYAYGSRTVGSNPVRVPGVPPRECIWVPAFILTEVCQTRSVPLILYRDPEGEWTDGSGPGEDEGGFDPGFSNLATEEAGRVDALSVVLGLDGYEGWATGAFGPGLDSQYTRSTTSIPPQSAVLRLGTGSEGWRPFHSPGAFEDYMMPSVLADGGVGRREPEGSKESLQVTYPAASEPNGSFIGQGSGGSGLGGRLFGLDSARDRFELIESARPQENNVLELQSEAVPHGKLTAIAPDAQGGIWAAVSGYMFHYTDQAPKAVFEETSNPFGARGAKLRALDGGPDGSVWAATNSDRIFRYDRIAGWEETRLEWDPGRVVTRASEAAAIAIGPTGEGLAVGEGGRIARLSASEVSLDPAAGRSCGLGDAIPCGTSRDLKAVDLAPDGSAIAAGERLSLLWRPSGGDFRTVQTPSIASSTTITAVSYPTPTRAYLGTNNGRLFGGTMTGAGEWTWKLENANARGDLISLDANRKPIAITDIAVDSSGHGYAVGDAGLVLERSGAGGWRRLHNPNPVNLTSVSLPERGGGGVLIGGQNGFILSGQGSELRLASPAGYHSGVGSGSVVGFAYLPGSSEGSVDAWAGIRAGEGSDRLLRYGSDPTDPALDPAGSLDALADAPAHVEGELSVAAFGKADCDIGEGNLCPEMSATTTTNEVVSDRIVDELTDRREAGELDIAVLSGDATDAAGRPGASVADYDRITRKQQASSPTTMRGQLKHLRYAEFVASDIEDAGLSLLGAIGGQDLSENFACHPEGGCHSTKDIANAGENYAWREAFGGRTEPWGSGEDTLEDPGGEVEIEPAPGSEANSIRTEAQGADADGDGPVPEAGADIGGASTHYAVDAVRDGEPVARIVFVDTSLGSLAANGPLQQPHELAGGQQRFLERMICREGQSSSFGDRCTREKDQKAIVVSNTPTYSYGPGALTHTATDATTFEALLLKHKVSLVISGALGYNGLYYTLAPGVHEPCPGADYPEEPPTGQTPSCVTGPAGPAGAQTPAAVSEAADPAALLTEQGLAGVLPTLIASGAGGKFGPDGQEAPDGPAGQWHGYSVARLLPNGDLVIEQRPVLDWVGMDAARHMMRPRQKLRLRGYGRSPISTTTVQQETRAFHYEISTAAITHRYELLRADPERPWLPLEDAQAGAEADGAQNCEGYVCLPEEVATVDSQSGEVKAGSGKHPPTYAVAMLSVADEVATYPLHFEPSPSFRFTAPNPPRPVPAIGAVSAPGNPSIPTIPQIPSVSSPQVPTPPALVPPPPAPPATPPQPPVPPPVPPANAGPSALSLSFAPTGLVVAPTASVIPPPAPPINPAPPGGARKEARQRQAATQKSGADGANQAKEEGVDLAGGPSQPEGSAMTRRTSPAPGEHPFTRLVPAAQPSAWSQGLQWGGALTLGALVLALTFSTLRPGPRRREPELPAPAWADVRRRGQ